MLLHYFGEDYPEENCGACDNCTHPKKQLEGKDYVIKALKVILAVNEKFKAEHVAHILSGNATSAVKSYKHHLLDIFGSGKEKDEKFWGAVLRQMLVKYLIEKEIENYGLLKITPKGHDFLKHPVSFMLVEDHDYGEIDEENIAASGRTAAVDDELLSILRDLRKEIARKRNLPPFVIFLDPSLEDMAIQYPVTLEELNNITGVGQGKALRYGKEFVEVIKKYVEEKEIVRPTEMVVKSVVNKSGLKVYIIQSIDRKISLDDIANAKNLEMSELLDEIESIVHSGTRLNLDYYINEVLDEEHQQEVFDYFKEEAEDESIESALSELGEDEYSEEDIRLMRIKFFSEIGN